MLLKYDLLSISKANRNCIQLKYVNFDKPLSDRQTDEPQHPLTLTCFNPLAVIPKVPVKCGDYDKPSIKLALALSNKCIPVDGHVSISRG